MHGHKKLTRACLVTNRNDALPGHPGRTLPGTEGDYMLPSTATELMLGNQFPCQRVGENQFSAFRRRWYHTIPAAYRPVDRGLAVLCGL